MKKNHIIKSFKVSEYTFNKFQNASMETGLKTSELSRLLFNRALNELLSIAQKNGWENLTFSFKEIN